MSRDTKQNDKTHEGAGSKATKSSLKLKLNRKTLRMLNREELALVAGGAAKHTCAEDERPC